MCNESDLYNDEGNGAMNTSMFLWVFLIIEVLLLISVLYKAFTAVPHPKTNLSITVPALMIAFSTLVII